MYMTQKNKNVQEQLILSISLMPVFNFVNSIARYCWNCKKMWYSVRQMLMSKVVFPHFFCLPVLFIFIYADLTFFYFTQPKNSVSPRKLESPLENGWLGEIVPQKWKPGFSNLAGARRKSPATSNVCVGYFSYFKFYYWQ